ncbi:MAG: hypothetical protein H6819_04305 [Phycisphaerales bacterium]|nr:hypothetical protein [Phycisphaerales bacterium]MCB9856421.1 hypothetical protein [Phycisphaerales bacterium]MCB9864552.1 hypothetical protein [Phycisphaerales bacterium]
MKHTIRNPIVLLPVAIALLASATLAYAGGHTWRVSEVFSNADGTIQYVEVTEAFGGAAEAGTAGHAVTSNTKSFTIPSNVTPPTTFRKLLIATPAFAALPGAPTPDYVLPAGSVPFFSPAGDSVRYVPLDTFTFGAGVVPTDGILSLNRDGSVGCNTPENYAGDVGFVNLGCTLQGDVDGSGAVDGGDVAAFVRVILGSPEVTDSPACAEYCDDTLAGTILAFVSDLLN